MPQPPVLTDVLQIEPGSGDTLTVSRDATTGALRLVDAVLTSGVLLPTLVGAGHGRTLPRGVEHPPTWASFPIDLR